MRTSLLHYLEVVPQPQAPAALTLDTARVDQLPGSRVGPAAGMNDLEYRKFYCS